MATVYVVNMLFLCKPVESLVHSCDCGRVHRGPVIGGPGAAAGEYADQEDAGLWLLAPD